MRLIGSNHRVLQGAARRGEQFYLVFQVLQTLFFVQQNKPFLPFITCIPVKGTPKAPLDLMWLALGNPHSNRVSTSPRPLFGLLTLRFLWPTESVGRGCLGEGRPKSEWFKDSHRETIHFRGKQLASNRNSSDASASTESWRWLRSWTKHTPPYKGVTCPPRASGVGRGGGQAVFNQIPHNVVRVKSGVQPQSESVEIMCSQTGKAHPNRVEGAKSGQICPTPRASDPMSPALTLQRVS